MTLGRKHFRIAPRVGRSCPRDTYGRVRRRSCGIAVRGRLGFDRDDIYARFQRHVQGDLRSGSDRHVDGHSLRRRMRKHSDKTRNRERGSPAGGALYSAGSPRERQLVNRQTFSPRGLYVMTAPKPTWTQRIRGRPRRLRDPLMPHFTDRGAASPTGREPAHPNHSHWSR